MKKSYMAASGVTHVNGQPVPSSRLVVLSEAEALYDLSLGRIELASVEPEKPRGKGRTGSQSNDRS